MLTLKDWFQFWIWSKDWTFSSLENVFTNEHVHDDSEQIIDLVSKKCSSLTKWIVSFQANYKTLIVINCMEYFQKKRFYPPKKK